MTSAFLFTQLTCLQLACASDDLILCARNKLTQCKSILLTAISHPQ